MPLLIICTIQLGYLVSNESVVFVWLISSFFLFALIDPWMRKLNEMGVPPLLSSFILVASFSLFMSVAGFLVYLGLKDIVRDIDHYRRALASIYRAGYGLLEHFADRISQTTAPQPALADQAVTQVEVVDHSAISGSVANSMWLGLGSALNFTTIALMVPVLAFFLVADRRILTRAFSRLFPGEIHAKRAWMQITWATSSFFVGNMIILSASFPLFAIAFWWFGVSNFLSLAIFAAFLNLIPFVGAIASSILPALNLMSLGHPHSEALILVLICGLIHFMIANLVTPKFIGARVDLNAVTSTVALIVWGKLLGPLGLFLAIPLTATLKIVFQNTSKDYLQWISLAMSEDPDSLFNRLYRKKPTDLNSNGH